MDRATHYLHPGHRYTVKVWPGECIVVVGSKIGEFGTAKPTIYTVPIVDFTDHRGEDVITVDTGYGLGEEAFQLMPDQFGRFHPFPLDTPGEGEVESSA